MPTHYRYLRCGDLRSPEVTGQRNGSHTDYATMMMMMMMMKDERVVKNGG